jgi:FkbM family methyltransferase
MIDKLNKDIVLYGFGQFGKKVFHFLAERNFNIKAIVDLSQTGNYLNTPIITLDAASKDTGLRKFQLLVCIYRPGLNISDIIDELLSRNFEQVYHAGILVGLYPKVFNHYLLSSQEEMATNLVELSSTRKLLNDQKSINIFDEQIGLRSHLNFKGLSAPDLNSQYFPKDLPDFVFDWQNEVFCDIGAYNGDTYFQLVNECKGTLMHYIGFEPDESNYRELEQNLSKEKISWQIFQKGTEEKNTQLRFFSDGSTSSGLAENGNVVIDCICLDDFASKFDYMPTYFKMDIEGAELATLKGMEHIIRTYKPKLAVCIYHTPNHIWEIPLFLKSIQPNYTFDMRSHEYNGLDTVLYCY